MTVAARPIESGSMPMGDIPAYQAARDPERPAVTHGETVLTRQQFADRSNELAHTLRAEGVGKGDFVTLALPNSIDYYALSFAAWTLGAIPSPVSASLPDPELRAIVELVRPAIVIGATPERVPGWKTMQPSPLSGGKPLARLASEVSPYWKAMTSGGSTGRPKVIVDHLPGTFDPTEPTFSQALDETLLNPGPLYHNAPYTMMHRGLFTGAHVIDMPRFDPLATLELIEKHRVTWINTVPTMMHRIWRLPREQREAFDMSSLRIFLHMAAPCPAWLKEEWINWLGGDRILEVYGGTEGIGNTALLGTEWLEHRGSVGRVIPGFTLQIMDDTGQRCATGDIGEIFFQRDADDPVRYHYLGSTARTLGDWESLGDLGYVDADNYLYLVDRRTDLIISGGANIYPAEIEAALDAHDAVLSSIVIGLPDDDLGHRVHAIVQLKSGRTTDVDGDAIRSFVAERLARYKVPRTVEFVATSLRDDAGKARRRQLREERIPAV